MSDKRLLDDLTRCQALYQPDPAGRRQLCYVVPADVMERLKARFAKPGKNGASVVGEVAHR